MGYILFGFVLIIYSIFRDYKNKLSIKKNENEQYQINGIVSKLNELGFVEKKTYINGVLNGKSITYYPLSNNIFETEFYVNNLLEGQYTRFSSNGVVLEQGIYENGKKIGIWHEYHDNGNLKSIIDFDIKTSFKTLNPVMKTFFENGNIKTERQGNTYKTYDKYGNIFEIIEIEYFDDKPKKIRTKKISNFTIQEKIHYKCQEEFVEYYVKSIGENGYEHYGNKGYSKRFTKNGIVWLFENIKDDVYSKMEIKNN